MLFISTANLVSALALGSALTSLVLASGPRALCDDTFLIKQGDTCASIGQEAGVSLSEIQSMNPGVNCGDTLPVGGHLCTRQFEPICTLNATATSQTCNSLAAKWNITVTDFVNYNDNVDDSCDDLVVGQSYCVSTNGCYPGNNEPLCQQ